MPRIAFAIATYNALPALKRCLRSIEKHARGIPRVIVVADDASTDGTRDYLRAAAAGGRVRAHLSSRNVGKSALLNLLASRRAGGADWVVCMDDDAEISEDWTAALIRRLEAYSSAAIIGCRSLDRASRIDCAELILGEGFGHGEYDLGQRNYVRLCDGVSGACMVVRGDVFRSIRFCEAMKQQFEDADFCFQARKRREKVVYCGKAWIRHEHLFRNAPTRLISRNQKIMRSRWGAIPSFPDSHPIDAAHARIRAYREKKNWAAILSECRALARVDTAPAYAYWSSGIALRRMGRDEEAKRVFEKALGCRYLQPLLRARIGLALHNFEKMTRIKGADLRPGGGETLCNEK